MKAAIYRGVDEGMVVEQIDDPTPGAHEVVIEVHRCGICGSDVHMTDGAGMMEYPAGSILGHEYAGVVADVSHAVTRVAPGDRVTALAMPGCGQCNACTQGDLLQCEGRSDEIVSASGAFAEYATTGEAAVVKLADGVDAETGALVEPLWVALHGVDISGVAPGDRATILGAGPIALSTLVWLRERGVDDVTVVATSHRRERYATALGATEFVAIDPADPTTHPAEADVVFEAAGTVGAISTAFGLTRSRGSVVSFGYCDEPDQIIPALVLMKELSLQFSMMYDRRHFERTLAALQEGWIAPTPLVSGVVSLDEFPEVFRDLHGTNDHCKVIVDPRTA